MRKDDVNRLIEQAIRGDKMNDLVYRLRKRAEMALEALECAYKGKDRTGQVIDAIVALEKALAQPVDAVNMAPDRVDETAKGEHEPVAWMHNFIEGTVITHEPADIGRHPDRWTPLYTAPPKRDSSSWVGLTDEEIHEVVSKKWWDWEDAFDIEGFSRAIEAKLKEKNRG